MSTADMSITSHLTFTQGFILGQASFLVIVLLFMRYVVFSPADKGDEEGWRRKRSEREKVSCVMDDVGRLRWFGV